ncbi:MAG: ribosome-binding factor A [Betaproteobacteria bacterium RIFCSPLOWO2_02_FULL_64_12]|nr:MAG: ribosome-binding factor A [Betaproteobacteria bacterium RIFCSPLOWO2_02_FULL_64_12]
MAGGSQRLRRIEDQIQRELSEILRTELKDPRVGMITVTGVEISPDLGHARVFFTMLGQSGERTRSEEGLRRASGFLRSALAKRLNTRSVPELRFQYDASIERGVRLSSLIDEAVSGKKHSP